MTCFDRDRFDGLQGEFCELDVELDVQPRGEHENISYGDHSGCQQKPPEQDDEETVWFFPSYTSGSNYSGNLGEVSNHRVLLAACVAADKDEDEVPDECRPFFVEFYGGHGTFAIALHIDRTPDSIVEMLEGLSNYPLLDDSDHSELEMEKQNEAWEENGLRDDYRQELEKAFTSALETFAERHGLEIDTDVSLSDVTDDAISSHFWHWSEEANEYWSNEEGDSMWINVEKVAEEAAENLFTDPEAVPEGWEWPEGIPANLAPVFVDPRQTLLPFKEGFPDYVPPPPTPSGPAPLTQQEMALIEEMVRLGWYKKDDRAGQVAHIMRMRAEATRRTGRGGLHGLDVRDLVLRTRRSRARLFDLASWSRRSR